MRISAKTRQRLASFALLTGSVLISLSAGEAATKIDSHVPEHEGMK
ncbi:MAG: hypothetical protein KGK33_11895 [Hyphomicrobiales bacterium]|nr:hypothetical protein [Hyphomicrobiales bacterium]